MISVLAHRVRIASLPIPFRLGIGEDRHGLKLDQLKHTELTRVLLPPGIPLHRYGREDFKHKMILKDAEAQGITDEERPSGRRVEFYYASTSR